MNAVKVIKAMTDMRYASSDNVTKDLKAAVRKQRREKLILKQLNQLNSGKYNY